MPVSFNILLSDSSGDDRSLSRIEEVQVEDRPPGRGRRGRRSRRRRKKTVEAEKREVTSEAKSSTEIQLQGESSGMEVSFETRSVVESATTTTTTMEVVPERVVEGCVSSVELRQRNVSGGRPLREEGGGNVEESGCGREGMWRPPLMNGSQEKLEKVLSLDWSEVMAEHNVGLEESSSNERLPFRYFMGEVYGGNALRNTISVGNDKKRQRVYNTMFHVPLRCERLIISGFFVCLDSFLSLLTIMPTRIAIILWRCFRQFQRPDAAELSDIGCFIVLAFGVIILQLTDISLIYHIIRGQGTIKLYVVYNVLEIFDKLLQSFGEDVLQVLFNSAEGLASCSLDSSAFELLRFTFDQTIAAVVFVVHSFILLAQAITLSTCIIAHNNALMALLVSNNFAEIKSNVFKRVSKDNLHSLVYYDVIERFHITAFVLFVLAQNMLEAEGSWFRSFVGNVLLVFLCEVFIDTIKHSFLAKFNEIKPEAYSEFLEDLCKQILGSQNDEDRKTLNFIPLAPACVVIRILTPIYATVLPYRPLLWRWFWIVSWSALTFLILTICKILVGLILKRLATWYINQRLARKQHVD